VQLVRWRPWLLAAAAYIAITIPFVSPLIDYRHLTDASYEGDSRLLIWTLAWDAHALLTRTPLFDANIYHPLPHALSHAEHHIGIGLFATPIYAVSGNAVLTYWVVWLLAFPLNAMAMHALAWRVTRDHAASFIAGVIYAFCFFRMHHAHGHLQLMWTWALPLVPLAIERWLERPTFARAAVVTSLVIVQALSSWYLAVFVGLLALFSIGVLAPSAQWRRSHVGQALVCLAVGALILGWFARPYVGLAPGPVEEAAANSADLTAYLLPPENTWLGQWLLRNTSLEPRWIWGEQTIYVGLTTLALAVAGVWTSRDRMRDGLLAAVILTGLLAFSLSFGPSSAGFSSFDIFAKAPGMGLLRAPARFALLVMMAAALLAAVGTAGLKTRVYGYVVQALLVCAILAESFVINFPGSKPKRMPTPRVYERLSTLPRGPVLSLPTYSGTPEAFRETDYLLFSTGHWQPIANGFGRQDPADHAVRMATLARFPNREALDLMRRIGIRYVVLHTGRASDLVERATAAQASGATQLISSADGDLLFEVPRRGWSDP
jgi:hypothetical protein